MIQKMKTYLTLIVLLLIGTVARAEFRLDSPEKLLQRASEGRIQLREVILDIQQAYPEMRDPVLFDSYFAILNDLKVQAIQFSLDEIYPLGVEKLGLKLVGHGVKWLSIGTHSTEKVMAYHKWMSSDVASIFIDIMDYSIRDLKSDTERKQAAISIDALIAWATVTFPAQKNLVTSYQRILSELANSFLKTENLSDDETNFWIGKISVTSGFSEYLEIIQVKLQNLEKQNQDQLHMVLQRLQILDTRSKVIFKNSPQWLKQQIGDVTVETVSKMLFFGVAFKPNEFEALLSQLMPRHVVSLASLLTSPDHLPKNSYAQTYLHVASLLVEKLKALNFPKESIDLSLYVGRIAAALIATDRSLEGTYALTDEAGHQWNFTLTQVKESLIYGALADRDRTVFKTFFNITYNLKTGEFLGADREPDLDPSPQPVVKFKFLDDGTILIEDQSVSGRQRQLKGRKIQNYPNYFKTAIQGTESIEGEYVGKMTFPGGTKSDVTLLLSNFNGYTIGRLIDQNGPIFDLNMGTTGTNGMVYLTTGRLKPAAFGHIRIQRDGNALRGFVIIGGFGIAPQEFLLKKK